MRDGVDLYTMVWDPSTEMGEERRAAVFFRSPYGPITEELADVFCPFGFVAVQQNERGTGLSGGNFSMWHTDPEDVFDTLAWISEQSWSNGVVLEGGFSADGICTDIAMIIPQPHMHGQLLMWSTAVGYNVSWIQGAIRQSLVKNWLDLIHDERPLAPSYYNEVLNREGYSKFWAEVTLRNFSNVNFPALHWGGWYDIFLEGQLDTYHGYQFESSPGGLGQQMLIIDPQGHCVLNNRIDYPHTDYALRWVYAYSVNTFLAQSNMTISPTVQKLAAALFIDLPTIDAVTLYIMGPGDLLGALPGTTGNYWTTLPTIPVPQYDVWTFTSAGGLVPGGGSEQTNASMSYVYDPSNPVPTLGGNNLFGTCGPHDQRNIGPRDDVLTFVSQVMNDTYSILGRISVELVVVSNCTDTDFTVKVMDVYPDSVGGDVINIQDGIIRMRWREEGEHPVLMTPGEAYTVNITLWHTSYVFNVGHQIRVDISSSSNSRFSVNPNNGLPLNATLTSSDPLIIAENEIFYQQSYLRMPMVSLSQIPSNVL
eukprot:TRINITY_DN2632_c0_g2_i1.p1 TRINITY_DN2632_c0_g2~~TRINITY_DN2632_c0_g2_i1.p1  ORF type:complete len:574 (+),score=57.69 TRINITY_DN2632_c0_g2_i1:113-1723(+)